MQVCTRFWQSDMSTTRVILLLLLLLASDLTMTKAHASHIEQGCS